MQVYECSLCGLTTNTPSCSKCTTLKESLSESELLNQIENIYLHKIIMKDMRPRSTFIGRYQPFHISHETLIRSKLKEGNPCLVLVRGTPQDASNPFKTSDVINMIRSAFVGEDVIVAPIINVEGVYYGRTTGYKVQEINLNEEFKAISATEIRKRLQANDPSWEQLVSPKVADWLKGYYAKNGS